MGENEILDSLFRGGVVILIDMKLSCFRSTKWKNSAYFSEFGNLKKVKEALF